MHTATLTVHTATLTVHTATLEVHTAPVTADALLPKLPPQVLQLLLEVLLLQLEDPSQAVALLPPLVDLRHEGLEAELAAPQASQVTGGQQVSLAGFRPSGGGLPPGEEEEVKEEEGDE